ncbi:MAG: RHS repeat-associated core domain-containing protein, partial [Fimbriimonadia bacterium]
TLYLLTGQQTTNTATVTHVGARHYSPSLRRWLQRDPVDINAGNPNLYCYVLNSPVLLNDPNGLQDDDFPPLQEGRFRYPYGQAMATVNLGAHIGVIALELVQEQLAACVLTGGSWVVIGTIGKGSKFVVKALKLMPRVGGGRVVLLPKIIRVIEEKGFQHATKHLKELLRRAPTEVDKAWFREQLEKATLQGMQFFDTLQGNTPVVGHMMRMTGENHGWWLVAWYHRETGLLQSAVFVREGSKQCHNFMELIKAAKTAAKR